MSGIAGIVGRGSVVEVERMATAMAYRGPNRRAWSPDAGVYLAEIGHDVLDAPGQAIALTSPVRDMAGMPVDLGELQQRLKSDPGECLRGLRGDFALAFYDPRHTGSLMLATDQISFRSLYVAQLSGRWAFASDYKALLALDDCRAEVNRDALQYYIATMSSDLQRPLLKGLKLLVRGAVARMQGDCFSVDYYARPPVARRRMSRMQSAQKLRRTLETVVDRHLRDRSHVAVTLSAGLDSSSLLALIRHVNPDVQISTYTIGFGAEDPEIIGARRSAEHFNTTHHELFFDNAELEQLLPRYVWLAEDLSGSGEAILQQKIVDFVGRKDRVLVAGHGADVAFAGMPRHRLLWLMGIAPPPIRDGLLELFKYTQTREPPASWLGKRLLRRAYGDQASVRIQVTGARPPALPENQFSLNGYLRANSNLLRSMLYQEPAEACAGLTPLMPFLDPDVRDCASEMPISHMIGPRHQKRVLRDAVADLMPDFLRNRPKAIQRLRHDQSLAEALLRIAHKFDVGRRMSARGLLRRHDVSEILGPPGPDRTPNSLADLWALVCSELWMQTFCDGRGRNPLS